MGRAKITLAEHQARIDKVNPNIEALEYVSNSAPSKCKCRVCGHVWAEPPKNLHRGSKCPKCYKRKKNDWNTEEFVRTIREKSPNIVLSGEYINMNTRFSCMCLVCGHKWTSAAKNLMLGKGCDRCAHRYVHDLRTKSTETFIEEMRSINPNIQITGEYVGAKEPIKCRCGVCGHVWTSQPTNLLQGCGCPECRLRRIGETHRKTHAEFVEDMRRIHPGIAVVSTYTRGLDPITLQCNKCGEQWTILAASAVVQACGCPTCSGSHGEQAIAAHLRQMGIEYQPQKRFDDLRGPGGGMLSYDFYIPSANTLIEYQGEYHDGSGLYQTADSFEYQRTRDALKRNYAKEHDYALLEIWYRDFKHIKSILMEHFASIQPTVA